ncbi:MAG: NUDIX domain-containing protein [Candidatus Aenigmarchaeota archaeon]|nr:NUDIX domain-containing protein [Candidatus Aenigmarchaeota archaeon]
MKQTKIAGGVVMNRKGLILIVNQNGNSWSLPKGHIDDGEEELTAAKREIYEESGVSDLELIKKLGKYKRYRIGLREEDDKSELKEITIFLFRTNQEILRPIDLNNPEARWVERDKVAKLLTHRKDKEFFLGIIDEL